MPRFTLLLLGMVAALFAAAPAAVAVTTNSLPAVAKSIKAQKRGACSSTSYRAPLTGYLDVRLSGRGDWDLELRDAAGTTLAASRAFGGREVGQAWVRGGQRITARGCRGRGAGARARTTFRMSSVALPKLPLGPAQLLRVQGSEKQLHALESAGLDVTHAMGQGWADVIVNGTAQLAAVVASGLRHSVRIADLSKSFAGARAADGRYAARVGAAGSPLPSGRTTYRTYDEVQGELKALVDRNAGVVRKVVFGTSYQGREISGVEIAKDVGADDGRPVFFLMALHHAREWPSMEAAMEFAHLLVQGQGDGGRIAGLLARTRIVILPLVNPDGYVSSRGAFDPGDALAGQDPNVTLVESIAPPGGLFAYRRKNCNGELTPALPCQLAWGVDPNRNYGQLWGGSGSSSDVTAQTYHGPAPRSESEVQAVWNYVRKHHVTTLLTVHNVAALVLRPPGTGAAGLAPDEARLKAIGDQMGAVAGYTSQYGYQLYDTSGTTEDDSYAATGGYGYTIEMGPPDGNFHMPYETGVVAEWTGDNPHAQGRGGLREALLVAAGAAAESADHAILRGTAPAGRVLRLHKRFETKTSPFCAKGVEPILIVVPPICLTGRQPPLTLDDELDATTAVPGGGVYEWHIGQSTRPFVGAVPGQKEAYVLTCEQPAGTVLERFSLVIDRGQAATLNVGCGAGPTTFANSAPVGGDPNAPAGSTAPTINGLPVPADVAPAAPTKKSTAAATRTQRLADCNKRAKRVRSAARRKAAQRSCTRRFAAKAPKPKEPGAAKAA